ncbi:unnamed protein product [Cyprideis torosa]|uniref:Uncharacterized protein n=1 Tax=Cyprideis torosa TaxID=163714 RepID=A0A7R8ZN48_9CRUS|nr:unnamed protein product [Cyprideis torosa]CAG0895368.1 unnamed protein product [Cyprideis torosa]
MKSMFFEFLLALAVVATIDGALDLSSNDRPRIPIYEGQCDPPFTPVEGSYCYFLSYNKMKSDWLSAQLVCSWLHPDGRLAEFETAEELVDVTIFLISESQGGIYTWAAPGPWIGAIELGDSNEFVWASSNSPIEVPNWSPSRPNSPTFGDGVALDISNSFEWIDLTNGTEVPILCEIPSNPPRVALRCPNGFFLLGGSCYAVFDDDAARLTWDEAQTFCGNLAAGGHLAELETAEEITFMKNYLAGNDYSGDRFWIGSEEIGDSNTFKWVSSGQPVALYDWGPDEPNNSGSGHAISIYYPKNTGPWIGAIELGDSNEFVWASSNSPIEVPNWSPSRPNSPTFGDGVTLDISNSFEWIDLTNGTEVPILCEIPSNSAPVELFCPDGFVSLGDSCYAVFDDDAALLNWDNAQTFCRSLAAGGRLVELETAEEITLLKGHLLESNYYCHWFWIGAEEFGNTNMYSWASTG